MGTAMGLLYVMDGESGFVRRFFPMQFHSIQAQVVVAALRSGGQGGLQMIVLDMGGTVAVVDLDGDILWDTHLSGTLPFPATVGDVDGDGSSHGGQGQPHLRAEGRHGRRAAWLPHLLARQQRRLLPCAPGGFIVTAATGRWTGKIQQ